MSLRLLDLFSGIGGFSLGLERAGFQTVAFCEVAPACRLLLAHHWPGVPIYEDVRTLRASDLVRDVGPIDAICGGFPCQDISHAGKGAGIDGKRSGLWREYARLIGELRPRLVFVENVSALLGRGLGRVLGDLAALGYDAEWDVISASAIGAPHKRERLWIVAYPHDGLGRPDATVFSGWNTLRISRVPTPWEENWPSRLQDFANMDDGLSHRLDASRSRPLGNAVVPQIPEILGRAALKALDVA